MMFLLIIWIICGLIASSVASSKGHNPGVWFLIGAIFGIFGLVAVMLLDNRKNQQSAEANNDNQQTDLNDTRECPDCAERIKKKAKICRYCGSVVEPMIDDDMPQQLSPAELTRERILRKAEQLGIAAEPLQPEDAVRFTHKGQTHDFFILKRANEFLDSLEDE